MIIFFIAEESHVWLLQGKCSTYITHSHGIAAVTYFMAKQEVDNGMHHSFLIDLFDFIHNHNYFTFDGSFYKQVSGTVMGARCAPSYVNLFLGWWETCIPWLNFKMMYSIGLVLLAIFSLFGQVPRMIVSSLLQNLMITPSIYI